MQKTLFNDLQIIGRDLSNNWVLGLVTLTIFGNLYEARYSEYRHTQDSSYFTQSFMGEVISLPDKIILNGFGEYVPHDGLSTVGEIVVSCRKNFIQDLRTISLREGEVSVS